MESHNTEFVDAVGMLRKKKSFESWKYFRQFGRAMLYVRTFIESHNTEFVDAVGMLRKIK